MTPRSRKPVLLVSGTNIRSLPKLQLKDCTIDSIEEEMSFVDSYTKLNIPRRSKSLENLEEVEEDSLSDNFKDYLRSRSILIDTPTKLNFSNCSDDSYSSPKLDDNEMSSSLLHCLDGYNPEEPDLLLKPKVENQRTEITKNCDGDNKLEINSEQFDNTKPVVYETSF